MDNSKFWAIIEAGGRKVLNDSGQQLDAVRAKLRKLSPEELIAFQRMFNQKLADAYTWDLWGTAYLINGGCSDDGFHYFRGWLISQGKAVYEAAVTSPESLAGLTDPDRDDYEFEELAYAPLQVYEELTDKEMPPAEFPWPAQPKGDQWDVDDDEEVTRRLPKLGKLYLR